MSFSSNRLQLCVELLLACSLGFHGVDLMLLLFVRGMVLCIVRAAVTSGFRYHNPVDVGQMRSLLSNCTYLCLALC